MFGFLKSSATQAKAAGMVEKAITMAPSHQIAYPSAGKSAAEIVERGWSLYASATQGGPPSAETLAFVSLAQEVKLQANKGVSITFNVISDAAMTFIQYVPPAEMKAKNSTDRAFITLAERTLGSEVVTNAMQQRVE